MRVSNLPRSGLLLSVLLVAACGGSGGAVVSSGGAEGFSAILVVTNLDDDGPGSLRDAVAQAPEGAGIVFDPDLPVGTIHLQSVIEVERSLTINGFSGTLQSFTLDGGGSSMIFTTPIMDGPRLALWGLVLTGGSAQSGGAISASGELVLRHVQMFGNQALVGSGFGGAIAFRHGFMSAEDCAFTANQAQDGGAIFFFQASANFKRCSFFLNVATGEYGGAVRHGAGKIEFTNCSFLQNQSDQRGGAIFALSSNGDASMVGLYACTVVGNHAVLEGGGVYFRDAGGPAFLDTHHSIIAQNTSVTSPDIHLDSGAFIFGSNTLLGVGGADLPPDGMNGNQVGVLAAPLDPMLDPVDFHTVGRAFRLPAAASAAVDQVDPEALVNEEGLILLDQRGELRDNGGMADLGAIER